MVINFFYRYAFSLKAFKTLWRIICYPFSLSYCAIFSYNFPLKVLCYYLVPIKEYLRMIFLPFRFSEAKTIWATFLKFSSSSLLYLMSLIARTSSLSFSNSPAIIACFSSIYCLITHFFWQFFTCFSMFYSFISFEQILHTERVWLISLFS